MRFNHPSNKLATKLHGLLGNKGLWWNRVYDDYVLKGIFMQRLWKSICYKMHSYCISRKNGTVLVYRIMQLHLWHYNMVHERSMHPITETRQISDGGIPHGKAADLTIPTHARRLHLYHLPITRCSFDLLGQHCWYGASSCSEVGNHFQTHSQLPQSKMRHFLIFVWPSSILLPNALLFHLNSLQPL